MTQAKTDWFAGRTLPNRRADSQRSGPERALPTGVGFDANSTAHLFRGNLSYRGGRKQNWQLHPRGL